MVRCCPSGNNLMISVLLTDNWKVLRVGLIYMSGLMNIHKVYRTSTRLQIITGCQHLGIACKTTESASPKFDGYAWFKSQMKCSEALVKCEFYSCIGLWCRFPILCGITSKMFDNSINSWLNLMINICVFLPCWF